MARLTPGIGAKGVFKFKSPWVAKENDVYTVTAIQVLSEYSRSGIDPFSAIYEPMGLKDGIGGFSSEAEVKENPMIITLTGNSGDVIVIPDTYIESFPDQSTVKYFNFVASIEIGIFEENEGIDYIIPSILDMCERYTGRKADGKLFRLELERQPTNAEHRALQRIKRYNIGDVTMTEEIERLRGEVIKLKTSNKALIKRLQTLGDIR